MKARVVWFLIGFLVSWAVWSAVSYVRLRPRDYSAGRDASEMPMLEWLKSAKGRTCGGYLVFTPDDRANASAVIYPSKGEPYPMIILSDTSPKGSPDSIIIGDSAGHRITVDDRNIDGIIDGYCFAAGNEPDAESWSDYNLDGQYDVYLGPGGVCRVFIASQWRDLIHEDKQRYVEVDGVRREVRHSNMIWSLVDE